MILLIWPLLFSRAKQAEQVALKNEVSCTTTCRSSIPVPPAICNLCTCTPHSWAVCFFQTILFVVMASLPPSSTSSLPLLPPSPPSLFPRPVSPSSLAFPSGLWCEHPPVGVSSENQVIRTWHTHTWCHHSEYSESCFYPLIFREYRSKIDFFPLVGDEQVSKFLT